MEDLSTLRKMSPPDAELFLVRHTLTPDEREKLTPLIGKDRPKYNAPLVQGAVQVHDPRRGLWMISVWLIGASWRQLARFHNVAPQTAMSVADRHLTSKERQILRLRSEMSLEALDTYHKSFTANVDMLSTMSPFEVANWLLTNTTLDNE